MSEIISSFRSLRARSQAFALLMLFLCVFLHTMSSDKSRQLLCIFPFAMHIALWYVVCHQYDVCENSVGSVYVGWYDGLAPPSWLRSQLGLVACKAYVFQWEYDGKQPSIVSLGTTSRLSGNQLEDDGSSVCVLSLACIGSSQPS